MPIVYRGRVFSVEVERRRFPNGKEHEVEIVRHAASVVLIPLEDDGRVILVKQSDGPAEAGHYRHASSIVAAWIATVSSTRLA